MFKKSFVGFLFLWAIIGSATLWIFHAPTDDSLEAYARLMAFSDMEKRGSHKQKTESTKQLRRQVSKQILFTKDGQRLQSRLSSEHSELVLDKTPKGAEIIEHFQEIVCSMQEELFFKKKQNDSLIVVEKQPIQLMRYLMAQHATYSYKTGQLQATDVELSRYVLPEHSWPASFADATPLLKGDAQSIQVSLFQSTGFKAQGLQATFSDWGGE